MKIVSAAEMREIDRVTSQRFGVSSLTLMENAGSAVAEFVLSRYPEARRIGVICGKGNNGGDGFVAARKLHEAGREVAIVLLADRSELRGDAAEMFGKLPLRPVFARAAEEIKQTPSALEVDLLIDAILGTGFRPPVSGLYAAAIAAVNASNAPVVAVDIPSGADADVMREQTGFVTRADAVVTFTAPRPAHVFGHVCNGPIVIAPIGSPDEAIASSLGLNLTTPQDVVPLIAPRTPDAHKGNFGHVLVIGGSVGKAGAAAMAGMAALRVGAGLSTVATAKSVLATVAGFHPEIMTEPMEETEAGSISARALPHMDEVLKGKTVLAVGPGISRHAETVEFIHRVCGDKSRPIILDADGLNAFAGRAAALQANGHSVVITPHPGEMSRLTGLTTAAVQHDRLNIARTFARDHGIIVVLKGRRTLIALPDGNVRVNATGNPGMATGGTGDILTGIVAGLIAQKRDQLAEAVTAAVYLHGLAGDIAREAMGEHSLVATDLLTALPEAFRRTREMAQRQNIEIGG
jgi:hydroxyethylthiazole kinase-like uncharacterized protein yjeF